MTVTNQLERIAGLVERLGPIAKKQRGMRIEAEQWNALVDVLLGVLQVDRAQEESTQVSLEQRFATKVHEHLGRIGITWLDPDLQTRLGGQQSSVTTRTALAEMDKKNQALGTEVARLTTLVELLQKQLDTSQVGEVDRSRVLRQFETRFAGIENLRTLVTTLNTDVDGVRGNINTLLELRQSLTDGEGNPIDVAKLRTELSEVQGLRENLKGVDGELLRLKDIELKLKEVADAAGIGGEGGLDKRLADLSAGMEVRLDARIDERNNDLRLSLEAQHADGETRLGNELKTAMDARAEAIDQSVSVGIAESETRIGLSMDAKIAASADTVRTDADASAKALIDARLAGVPDQVRATTAAMIAGLKADLAGELSASLTREIQTRTTALESSLNTRMGTMESRLAGFEDRIPNLVADSVDAARETLRDDMNQQLDGRLEETRTALLETLTGQIQRVVADSVGNLDGRIAASLDERLVGLDETIAQSVTAATRNLPEQIGTAVKRHVAELDLPASISAANASLARQLRLEQAEALARQQATISESINGSVTLLRGEIDALRSEVKTTIDTRLRQNNTLLQETWTADIKGLERRLKPDVFRTVIRRPDQPIP